MASLPAGFKVIRIAEAKVLASDVRLFSWSPRLSGLKLRSENFEGSEPMRASWGNSTFESTPGGGGLAFQPCPMVSSAGFGVGWSRLTGVERKMASVISLPVLLFHRLGSQILGG